MPVMVAEGGKLKPYAEYISSVLLPKVAVSPSVQTWTLATFVPRSPDPAPGARSPVLSASTRSGETTPATNSSIAASSRDARSAAEADASRCALGVPLDKRSATASDRPTAPPTYRDTILLNVIVAPILENRLGRSASFGEAASPLKALVARAATRLQLGLSL